MKDCCFGWVGGFPQRLLWLVQLLFSFFSCCKLMMRKSCPRISLSMKDCGAAGRAAKSPLQILFWKTFEGFFFFNLQISLGGILSVFLYFIFSSSPPCWKTLGRVVRCRLREIPADVLFTSFTDFFPRVFWFVSLCSALLWILFWRRLGCVKDMGWDASNSWKHEVVKDNG